MPAAEAAEDEAVQRGLQSSTGQQGGCLEQDYWSIAGGAAAAAEAEAEVGMLGQRHHAVQWQLAWEPRTAAHMGQDSIRGTEKH